MNKVKRFYEYTPLTWMLKDWHKDKIEISKEIWLRLIERDLFDNF